MRRYICIFSFVFISLLLQACEGRRAKNYNSRTGVDDVGLDMIKNGYESGNAEIRFSKLAEHNSQDPEIIAFAKMMITDHTSVSNDLKKIANDKKVDITDSLTIEHAQLADSLAAKKGLMFNRQYMQVMVADHQKAISLFKNASANTDITVNKFAAKILPKFESHLKQAEELYTKIK